MKKNSMLEKVDRLGAMFAEGIKQAAGLALPENYQNFDAIVVAGMGGSAISGDIAQSIIGQQLSIPLFVSRGYALPAMVTQNTLFIALSYSGNTEETLSQFEIAQDHKAKIVGVTSGGALQNKLKEKNYPSVIIPPGLPPRSALGYLLSSLLMVLHKAGVASSIDKQWPEAIELLTTGKEKSRRAAKKLAHKIKGKIPVIFASVGETDAAGMRWKTQFNENSKTTALLANFPELNHNEIVNLGELHKGKHPFHLLILRSDQEHERIKKRIAITKKLLSGKLPVDEIWSKGKCKLARTMSLVLFGDYLSVYLALEIKVDPTPVAVIEQLKKEMAK